MQTIEEKRSPYGSFEHLFEAILCSRESEGAIAYPHHQEMYEILYSLDGVCRIYLGTKTHIMRRGDMALFDPMEPHRVDCISSRCEYIVLKFAGELLCPGDRSMNEAQLFMRYQNSPDTHRKIFPGEMLGEEIPPLIHRLFDEARHRGLGFELSIRGDMSRLFLWILRHTPLPDSPEDTLTADETLCMQNALEYIQEKLFFDLSLTDAAKNAGMSYTAFSRLFTRAMRAGFPDYVQRRRLEYADILLATTNKSITDIAMETGFSSISYFIYCFRRLRGVTPAKFRRSFESVKSTMQA